MIFEGVKLTLLGMSIVFLFLILMVLVIQFSAWFLQDFTKKEIDESLLLAQKRKRASSAAEDKKRIGVIAAAIAAHRKRYGAPAGS